MKIKLFLVYIMFCLLAIYANAADTISPEDAINHIGKQATVCGNVASTHFSTRSKSRPTFINLNRPYPNHIFTVLIWGSDRRNFPASPENYYRNKRICVTGIIQQYKGMPEIIARTPSQIREEK